VFSAPCPACAILIYNLGFSDGGNTGTPKTDGAVIIAAANLPTTKA
jgi:hypothetical protein